MKTQNNYFTSMTKAILSVFVATLMLSPFTIVNETKAGQLTDATVTLSETFRSLLDASASAGATSLSVIDGSGFVATDAFYITDGTLSETGTISTVTTNTLTVGATTNAYDVDDSPAITVLSGIEFGVKADTDTAGTIDTARLTLSAAATGDGGSFLNVSTIDSFVGITGAAAPLSQTKSTLEIDVTSGVIAAGTTTEFDINGVLIPTGASSSTYYFDLEYLDSGGDVIDSQRLYFFVDNGHIVKGNVDSTLTATIADDGTDNNPTDATTDPNITLDTMDTDTEDSATTGHGVDGNLITVTTNASNGYTITIQDTTNGLVNPDFVGGGRPSGTSDDGIDDVAAGAWPAAGTEAYGYAVGATFDSAAAGTYAAFTASPVTIETELGPISADTTFVTVRAQIVATTPSGVYTDLITYIITPNF